MRLVAADHIWQFFTNSKVSKDKICFKEVMYRTNKLIVVVAATASKCSYDLVNKNLGLYLNKCSDRKNQKLFKRTKYCFFC